MSWDRDDELGGNGEEALPPEDAREHEIPPPATYAGRRRSEPGDDDFEAVDRGVEEELDGLDELDDEELDDEEFDDGAHAEGEEPDEEPDEELDQDDERIDEPEPIELREDDEGDWEDEADEPEAEGEVAEEQIEADDVAAAHVDEGVPDGNGDEVSAEPEDAAEEDAEEPSREQSTDAALAGLRARTAGKSAGVAADSAEPTVATPAVAVADEDEEGKAPHAKPVWARFLAASLMIVASVAAATSISLLLFLTDIAAGLGGIPDIEDDLTNIDPGGPQTILILGSDKRPTDDTGRSDTAILLRVDPDKKAISLLSIPRDLKVNIPGYGQDKFNAAYSLDGPELTLKTVKSFTGLEINHVVNVNFTGFADAVNAIDCVYIDVDRHYFIDPTQDVAEIDVEAGYQRMCGLNALSYVRYRHTDNDLVRAARQQDFIREARQNLPPSKLIDDRDELLDIFADYTTSDNALKDPVAVLELLRTFYAVRNVPVREVHFPAQLEEVYVTANDEAIKRAIDEFLGTGGTPGPTPPGDGDGDDQGDDKGGGKGGGDKKDDEKKEEPKPEGPPMTDASGAILPYAQRIAETQKKNGDPMVPFDIYYPTLVPPDAQVTPTVMEASRAFPIDGPDKDVYYGYKLVMGLPGSAGFTEYWGVSGTSWTDPPILENPSETREIDGREYMLYYDGDRLRLVGWKSKNASYWVNNTLLQTLEEGEMLSIATHMRELND